jgi:hypothetical protein
MKNKQSHRLLGTFSEMCCTNGTNGVAAQSGIASPTPYFVAARNVVNRKGYSHCGTIIRGLPDAVPSQSGSSACGPSNGSDSQGEIWLELTLLPAPSYACKDPYLSLRELIAGAIPCRDTDLWSKPKT